VNGPTVELDRLAGNPEGTPSHPPVMHELLRHIAGSIDADGKADVLCAPRHRCVDADNLAAPVCQRSAGIPRVESGVGLDDALDETTGRGPQAPPERADDPGGHRRVIPERVADSDDQLSDAQLGGTSESGMFQIAARDAKHGKIGFGIVAHNRGLDGAAVRERYGNSGPISNDMAVSKNVAVRRVDDARPQTQGSPILSYRSDADHGRPDSPEGPRDQIGIGVKQLKLRIGKHTKRNAFDNGVVQPGPMAGHHPAIRLIGSGAGTGHITSPF